MHINLFCLLFIIFLYNSILCFFLVIFKKVSSCATLGDTFGVTKLLLSASVDMLQAHSISVHTKTHPIVSWISEPSQIGSEGNVILSFSVIMLILRSLFCHLDKKGGTLGLFCNGTRFRSNDNG